ncbi:MAG: adenylate/guanylate cyclase domain-containing protein [Pseudomonadota bacterium]
MTQRPATLAILFADIAQSTKLYEKIGNSAAQRLIATCLGAMSDVCMRHGGTVIKTIGDEIMCTFPTAAEAVDAGRKMQSAIEKIPSSELPDGHAPNIYVGIHYGPVILEKNDIFGDAVNVAARMVGLAKQRQIITTQETVNALSPDYSDCIRCIDKTMVKGKSAEMLIYEVNCEEDTMTVMLKTFAEGKPATKHRLELRFNDTTFEVSDSHPVATLGRQNQNDVVVKDSRVSRFHARVEYRKEKYFLIDQSTNGTYVAEQGMAPVLLNRDEIQLDKSGVIDLCNEGTPVSPTAIHYTVK